MPTIEIDFTTYYIDVTWFAHQSPDYAADNPDDVLGYDYIEFDVWSEDNELRNDIKQQLTQRDIDFIIKQHLESLKMEY